MKTGILFLLRLSALALAAAGCSSACKEGTEPGVAGTSIGCGNPPSISELETTEVNACPSLKCNAVISPQVDTVTIGKTIGIHYRFNSDVVSPEIQYRIYAAAQIPLLRSAPLDSFTTFGANAFQLLPGDLANSVRAGAGYLSGDSTLFVFNIHILLKQTQSNLVFLEEGLVTGIGLDLRENRFVSCWPNPFRKDSLSAPMYAYQGKIAADSALSARFATAASAHIFVSGSPFATTLDLADQSFRLDSLPKGPFELRMFTLPLNRTPGDKIPVYLVTSPPDSLSTRSFILGKIVDSIVVPE